MRRVKVGGREPRESLPVKVMFPHDGDLVRTLNGERALGAVGRFAGLEYAAGDRAWVRHEAARAQRVQRQARRGRWWVVVLDYFSRR